MENQKRGLVQYVKENKKLILKRAVLVVGIAVAGILIGKAMSSNEDSEEEENLEVYDVAYEELNEIEPEETSSNEETC